jgi:hypothetical protein
MLTIYALKGFDNFPEAHSFSVLGSKVGQDARSQGDLLVKVTLREAVVTQFKLRRMKILKVCIKYAEGVKLCDMVSAHLVCTDQ